MNHQKNEAVCIEDEVMKMSLTRDELLHKPCSVAIGRIARELQRMGVEKPPKNVIGAALRKKYGLSTRVVRVGSVVARFYVPPEENEAQARISNKLNAMKVADTNYDNCTFRRQRNDIHKNIREFCRRDTLINVPIHKAADLFIETYFREAEDAPTRSEVVGIMATRFSLSIKEVSIDGQTIEIFI